MCAGGSYPSCHPEWKRREAVKRFCFLISEHDMPTGPLLSCEEGMLTTFSNHQGNRILFKELKEKGISWEDSLCTCAQGSRIVEQLGWIDLEMYTLLNDITHYQMTMRFVTSKFSAVALILLPVFWEKSTVLSRLRLGGVRRAWLTINSFSSSLVYFGHPGVF